MISDNSPIDVLNLSVRTYNCLMRANIDTVQKLLDKEQDELLKIRNLGRKSLEEIIAVKDSYTHPSIVNAEEKEEQIAEELKPIEELSAEQEEEAQEVLVDERPIKVLNLSVRAYNCLTKANITTVQQLIDMKPDGLLRIRNLGIKTLEEITSVKEKIISDQKEIKRRKEKRITEEQQLKLLKDVSTEREEKAQKVLVNERQIEVLNLSVRAYNCLKKANITTVQQLMGMKPAELLWIRNLVRKTLEEITAFQKRFNSTPIELIEKKIGNFSVEELKPLVMALFTVPFKGLSFREFRAGLPEAAKDETIKQAVGSLLEEGKLEYVDYRCYRVYPSFFEYFEAYSDKLSDRSRDVLERRYAGETLETIAKSTGITRERVRQIFQKENRKLRIKLCHMCENDTGSSAFTEDFYEPLFVKADLPKEFWINELGLSNNAINYLYAAYDRGKCKPEEVLGDEEIPVSLRYRLRCYLDRDKIRIDGMLFPRSRSAIEDYALQKYAQDELPFSRFIDLYNGMLDANRIPFDEKLYYRQENIRSRANRFSASVLCLWKQGERLRFYDIMSRDYTDLLESFHLESYHDTTVSTRVFFDRFPSLMEKYDIHDPYELHNLLKKIADKYKLNTVKFIRQPILQFGVFDRKKAVRAAMLLLAPVTQTDLIEYLYQKYGYDKSTAVGYLTDLSAYCHDGVYTIDFKRIPEWRIEPLQQALTDDFYYIDEIKRIYSVLFEDADPEEINPWALKAMGFVVNSNYVIQHYPSAAAFFTDILTKDDVYDMQDFICRFGSIIMFSQRYSELLKEHRLFRFAKNQIISMRRLERLNVTDENLNDYCTAVYNFVDEDRFFTMSSLRQDGFSHPLDNLGFDDYFYESLLGTDDRFSQQRVFGSTVLFNGSALGRFSTDVFLQTQLREYESTDPDEFMEDIKDRFGIKIPNRYEVTSAVKGTELYYDSIMDKIYRNKTLYYADFDE